MEDEPPLRRERSRLVREGDSDSDASDHDDNGAPRHCPCSYTQRLRRWLLAAVVITCALVVLGRSGVLRKLVTLLQQLHNLVSRHSPRLVQWIRNQRITTLVAIVVVLLVCDIIPVVCHILVKPLQIALALTLDPRLAVGILVPFVFTSCMLTFGVGRLLLRDPVRRWAEGQELFHTIDLAMTRPQGLRLAVLWRFAPIPEVLASYTLSVTSVPVSHYAIAAAAEACKSTCLSFYAAMYVHEGSRALVRVAGIDWKSLVKLTVGALFVVLILHQLRAAVHRELLEQQRLEHERDVQAKVDLAAQAKVEDVA